MENNINDLKLKVKEQEKVISLAKMLVDEILYGSESKAYDLAQELSANKLILFSKSI